MRIAIVGGTGKQGEGLAIRWARGGHEITVGSRRIEKATERASALSARGGVAIAGRANEDAVADADVAVLCVPWSAHAPTLGSLAGVLRGRVVIDMTVPLQPPKVRIVHLPDGESAAKRAQEALGAETPLAAALHHVSSKHLADIDHALDGDVLVCTDHEPAWEVASGLIDDLGMRAVHAGALANAVALESLTPVLLHINRRYKSGGSGIRITDID